MKLIDLQGKRFGRLVVHSRAENIGKQSSWVCLCDCGVRKAVRSDHLREGKVVSCGCLGAENRQQGNNRRTHGGSHTRLYSIWLGIHKRCSNARSGSYDNYGGRGITVCAEWSDFVRFRDWALTSGYTDELSIDRIDNDKGYSPGNCRWTDAKAQANNRRPRSCFRKEAGERR